jgi:hypothetical protein
MAINDSHDGDVAMTIPALDRSTETHGLSPVPILLKSEAAAVLGLSLAAYSYLGFSWWICVALSLAPDLAFLGYLGGSRLGAWAYDLAHTYVAPIAFALAGYLAGEPWLMAGAAIWAMHIAVDRLVGYGLKFPADPRDTHLSRLSAKASRG